MRLADQINQSIRSLRELMSYRNILAVALVAGALISCGGGRRQPRLAPGNAAGDWHWPWHWWHDRSSAGCCSEGHCRRVRWRWYFGLVNFWRGNRPGQGSAEGCERCPRAWIHRDLQRSRWLAADLLPVRQN